MNEYLIPILLGAILLTLLHIGHRIEFLRYSLTRIFDTDEPPGLSFGRAVLYHLNGGASHRSSQHLEKIIKKLTGYERAIENHLSVSIDSLAKEREKLVLNQRVEAKDRLTKRIRELSTENSNSKKVFEAMQCLLNGEFQAYIDPVSRKLRYIENLDQLLEDCWYDADAAIDIVTKIAQARK